MSVLIVGDVQMMMFGIDEEVAKLFVKDSDRFPKDTDVTKASGIDTLLAGSQIQEFCFDPCGYSMNGLLYDAYWTIHITPESHCSYASFETNIRMSNYSALIKSVLAIFKPKKWTMTMFADTAGLRAVKESPFHGLFAVPVVESTSKAIAGPCVVTRDVYGNSSISFADSLSPKALSPSAMSPVATSTPTASNEDSDSVVPPANVLADALVAAATASGNVFEESKTPGAASLPSSRSRKGAMSYLLTTKSQTDFIGEYTAAVGNYTLVHSASNVTARSALAAASEAVKESVPHPRAKYVVAKRVQVLQTRLRTESL